jgi:hypothetical protein
MIGRVVSFILFIEKDFQKGAMVAKNYSLNIPKYSL